jgi:hypothetical protein
MRGAFLGMTVLFGSQAAVAGPINFVAKPHYQSAADSPLEFTAGKSYLEDFESGAVSALGLTVSTGVSVKGASSVVRGPSADPPASSVDPGGHSVNPLWEEFDFVLPQSFWSGLWLDFDPTATGFLPTAVGFVWTDAVASANELRVRAYGASGNILDEWVQTVGASDKMLFVGMSSAEGIASISVSSWTRDENSWFQLDHVQYGVAVPEPTSISLLLVGTFSLLFGFLSRRLH